MKRLFAWVIVLLAVVGCGGGTINDGPLIINPGMASVAPGGSKQFTVNQDVLVEWSAPDGGSITSYGLYTAPNVNGTYHVVATGLVNPLLTAVATVTVSNVQVEMIPSQLSAAQGQVFTNGFTAIVSGTANANVAWSISLPSGGTIVPGTNDPSGNARATYTAGSVAGYFTIRATSVADPNVSAIAQVRVLGASSLSLSPLSTTVTSTAPNNTATFTAVLTKADGTLDTTTPLIWDMPLNPAGATLSGSDLRERTVTVPPSFSGAATLQIRVRTSQGIAAISSIYVTP